MLPASQPVPDLTDVRNALRAGRMDAVDLLADLGERTTRFDPAVGSFLERFELSAGVAAREHERARRAGEHLPPLSGIPIGIKALLSTREAPASAQSLVVDPTRLVGDDATAVARLRGSGAVIVGHNTMVEYALGRPDPAKPFPVPRNPWDLERWPGGSSSGTANGLAAGFFLGGLGTDTTGSIRLPAAMCGLTGLKPSFGLVPVDGCLPASASLDVVGPLTRSARDARLLMNALVPGFGVQVADPRRIGIAEELLSPQRGVSPAVTAAVQSALAVLETEGYAVEPLALPEFDELVGLTMCLALAETFAVHRDRLREHWGDYGRSFRRVVTMGAALSPQVVAGARVRLAELRARVTARLSGFTAIATPTWPTGAAPYAAAGGVPVQETNFTAAWNALGFSSLALPAGFDDDGMPVGLLLSAPAGSDSALLTAGEALQAADDTHLRAPVLEETAVRVPFPVPDLDPGDAPARRAPTAQPEWLAALQLDLDPHELEVIGGMGSALIDAFTVGVPPTASR